MSVCGRIEISRILNVTKHLNVYLKWKIIHGSAIIKMNEWSQLCGPNLGCFKNKKTKTDLLIFPLVFPEPSRNVLHQIVNKRVDVHLPERLIFAPSVLFSGCGQPVDTRRPVHILGVSYGKQPRRDAHVGSDWPERRLFGETNAEGPAEGPATSWPHRFDSPVPWMIRNKIPAIRLRHLLAQDSTHVASSSVLPDGHRHGNPHSGVWTVCRGPAAQGRGVKQLTVWASVGDTYDLSYRLFGTPPSSALTSSGR